jgi:hypothetical protein
MYSTSIVVKEIPLLKLSYEMGISSWMLLWFALAVHDCMGHVKEKKVLIIHTIEHFWCEVHP